MMHDYQQFGPATSQRGQSFTFFSEPAGTKASTAVDMEPSKINGTHSRGVSMPNGLPPKTPPIKTRRNSKRSKKYNNQQPSGSSSPNSTSSSSDTLPPRPPPNSNGYVVVHVNASTSPSDTSTANRTTGGSGSSRRPKGAEVIEVRTSTAVAVTRGGTFSSASNRPPGTPPSRTPTLSYPMGGNTSRMSTSVYNSRDTHNETIISNQSEQFHASTSESLQHCSDKILCHYNRLITVIGWRPLLAPRSTKYGLGCLIGTLNFLYLVMILLLLLTGYVLQYATCFRQDNLSAYDPLIIDSAANPATTRGPHFDLSPRTEHDYYLTPDEEDDSTFFNFRSDTPTTTTIKPSTTAQLFLNATANTTRQTLNTLDQTLRRMLESLYQRYQNLSYHNAPGRRHQHEQLYRCRGGLGTYYIIPALIHFSAFLAMLSQMRMPETDKFHNLCVVTYLLMTKTVGRDKASHRLTRMVRGWLLFGAACLTVTLSTHFLHLFVISEETLCFTFFQPSSDTAETLLTGICLVLFGLIDFICIAIFTTYSLHCELNVIFLDTNVTAMREKRINFREFTKNTEDSKTNLDYLNTRHSIGVSILLIHFVSRLFVVLIESFLRETHFRQGLLSGLACLFWLSLVLTVFIQAARVTYACKSVRHIGHELRSRPFCYQTAPYSDLDSLLNYTSTLHMSARLLMVPIRASCVATVAIICVIVFLVLGQINVIQF